MRTFGLAFGGGMGACGSDGGDTRAGGSDALGPGRVAVFGTGELLAAGSPAPGFFFIPWREYIECDSEMPCFSSAKLNKRFSNLS